MFLCRSEYSGSQSVNQLSTQTISGINFLKLWNFSQITAKMQLSLIATILSICINLSVGHKEDDKNATDPRALINLERDNLKPSPILPVANLEARIGDGILAKDIVDRLQALDADIGKLLYNSTSMYGPNDSAYHDGTKGGEKFTEILNDLDSLQDDVSSLINGATRTRQYNMLVRLRPLNNVLYRIRNNLYLMRNSLVAINAVSSLEKISNSVIDSTLQVFMKPEVNGTDDSNAGYDIDMDKMEFTPDYRPASEFKRQTQPVATTASDATRPTSTSVPLKATPGSTVATTTTTIKPSSSQPTKRPSRRPATRRNNQRTTSMPNSTRTDRPTTDKLL